MLAILNTRSGAEGQTDISLILAHQLIASKLNVANGCDSASVITTIDNADALLSRFAGRLPYMLKRSTPAGRATFNNAVLSNYNHGNLTSGCDP